MSDPFRPLIVVLILVSLFLSAAAGPATAPANPDLSTPKSAVKAFYTGIRRGDADALKAATNAPDAAHEKLVASFAKYIASRVALRRAIVAKFGPDAAPADPALPDDKQINAATVEEHGSHAAVSLPSGSGNVVKSGGQWKMAGLDSLPNEVVDPSVKWLDQSTAEMKGAVAKLKDGTIQSAEEASQLVAKYPLPFIHVAVPSAP